MTQKLKPLNLDPGSYAIKTLPSEGTPQVLVAASSGNPGKLSLLNLYYKLSKISTVQAADNYPASANTSESVSLI